MGTREIDGDGPPKGGFWETTVQLKPTNWLGTPENVESGETKKQQKQAIVWARGANL